MTHTPDLSTAVWRKSSYSAGGDNDCVEVADGYTGVVPVRDSKTPTSRPLVILAGSWLTFVDSIRGQEDA
jgi:hypothetical protein